VDVGKGGSLAGLPRLRWLGGGTRSRARPPRSRPPRRSGRTTGRLRLPQTGSPVQPRRGGQSGERPECGRRPRRGTQGGGGRRGPGRRGRRRGGRRRPGLSGRYGLAGRDSGAQAVHSVALTAAGAARGASATEDLATKRVGAIQGSAKGCGRAVVVAEALRRRDRQGGGGGWGRRCDCCFGC
jgi:hypothetical protein